MPSKPAAVLIEAEMDLSLAVEVEDEQLAILKLKREIEKMTIMRTVKHTKVQKKVKKCLQTQPQF